MNQSSVGEARTPLVSVVTPSFNAGEYIEQTIMSVRCQEYPRVEHIIVDGGSTDDTISILKKYERTYNMRWLSEQDSGMYEAINKGMRLAEGQILTYLNADDLYFPWTTRVVVESLRRCPGVDVLYGDCVAAPTDARYGSIEFFLSPPERILRTHLRFHSIGQPAVFWRRRVFETLGGFDESFRTVGDYDFWVRATKKFRFLKLDEVLAFFRIRRGSLSTMYSNIVRQEVAAIRMKHLGQNSSSMIVREKMYELLLFGFWFVELLRLLVKTSRGDNLEGAWKHLAQARVISPPRLLNELVLLPRHAWERYLSEVSVGVELKHRPGYVDLGRLIGIALKSPFVERNVRKVVSWGPDGASRSDRYP